MIMSTEHEREALGRVERILEDMARSLADVRERVAKIEAMAQNGTVEALRSELGRAHERIATLEADRHVRLGQATASKTWSEWSVRLAPWLFATALVVWNYFKPPG